MDFETVKYEKKRNVAYITLNRPQALNACNMKMFEEMPQVWADFKADHQMRVAILTGAGDKAFCTGLDLGDQARNLYQDTLAKAAAQSEPEALRMGQIRLSARQNDVFKPVICAINGIICSGGFHFLIGSDIILCSENATFFDTHVSVGLVAQRTVIGLSRIIGYSHAMRIGLMGRHERLDAQRAYEIGLVTEIVSQDRLLERAQELADTILLNAPKAMEGTIEAMWKGLNLGLDDALKLSGTISRMNFTLEESNEGANAFAEKRQPVWHGK